MAEGMTREEIVDEIRLTEQALIHAGPIHHRDLRKHLNRMRKELQEYDRYQGGARRRDV